MEMIVLDIMLSCFFQIMAAFFPCFRLSSMHKLEKYVGRLVFLKEHVYQKLRAKKVRAIPEENFFLVAAIDRRLNQLVCYGAGHCINACVSDIVLI